MLGACPQGSYRQALSDEDSPLIDRNALPVHPADLPALGRLAIDGVLGVTDLVEHMHASIAAPLRRSPERTRGLTGGIYRTVRGITRGVGAGVTLALSPLQRIDPGPPSRARENFRAAINGVFGDHLEATENPLALDLALKLESPQPDTHFDPNIGWHSLPVDAAGRELVVFLHGLCLHPGHWRPEDAESMPARLRSRSGRTILQVHYNTGRSIEANGAALAEALEKAVRDWNVPVERIALIGHSMGGLVARSAAHHGQLREADWVARLNNIITLGSPHGGAPLERAGHGLDQVLGVSRYTRPFTRIGSKRSAGIVDLRHGRITRQPTADQLPANVKLHLVAGSRSSRGDRLERGDGLVPIASALAADRWQEEAWVDRLRIHECGHLALMHHPEAIDYVESAMDH